MSLQVYNTMVRPDQTLAYQAATIPNEQKQALALSFGRVNQRTKLIAAGTAFSLAALALAIYASNIFKAVPKIPCNPQITLYRVTLSGDCSKEEIAAAYAQSNQLFDDRQVELKAEARRDAGESSKKWQVEIDNSKGEAEKWRAEVEKSKIKTKELIADRDQTIIDNERSKIDIDKLIAERDQWILDQPERLKKLFPTPEEVAFKKAVQKIEIDCEMDEKFLGWPGYEPRGCELDGLNLLGAAEVKNCDELKSKYRKVSLQYHPDKNNSTEAKQKFIDISNVYQRICS